MFGAFFKFSERGEGVPGFFIFRVVHFDQNGPIPLDDQRIRRIVRHLVSLPKGVRAPPRRGRGEPSRLGLYRSRRKGEWREDEGKNWPGRDANLSVLLGKVRQ